MSASVKVCAFFVGAPGDPMTNITVAGAPIGEKRIGVDTSGRLAEYICVIAGEALTALKTCMWKAGTAATNVLAWTAMLTAAATDICCGVPPCIIDSGNAGWLQRTGFLANVVVASVAFTVGNKVCVSGTAGTGQKYAPTLAADMADSTATETALAIANAITIFGEAAETATTTALDMKLYCR